MKITPKIKALLSAAIVTTAFAANSSADALDMYSQTLTETNFDAYALEQVMPEYPESMREIGRQGRVLVEVDVSESGDILDVKVVAASQPEFGNAAVSAISEWLFEPGKRNGVTVAQTVMVPVDFMIEKPGV